MTVSPPYMDTGHLEEDDDDDLLRLELDGDGDELESDIWLEEDDDTANPECLMLIEYWKFPGRALPGLTERYT